MVKSIFWELFLIFRKPILVVFVGILFFIAFIPIVTYFYFANDLRSKASIMNSNDSGVILLDRKDRPFFNFYQAKYKNFVPLSDIPINLQNAVISAEDKEFYKHPGFSITAIGRALLLDIKKEKLAYGASTITQQLIKNVILNPQKSIIRKYQEIVLASEIERRYTKKEILEMYLNSVYFGQGAFGVEQASRTYFGKSAKDLDLAESAMLAGLLPAPSEYNPISGKKGKAQELQKIVLGKMSEQGYITNEQKKLAEKKQLTINPAKGQMNFAAPNFALMVKDELINKYGEERIARSGFTVKTSIDLDWQEYAENAVRGQVDSLSANGATNGSAVVLNPKTGEILVMVGSKDWNNENFGKVNMALAPRQPGSSFKPIVYSVAFEEKIINPSTILKDVPTTFEGNYKPKDFDGRFRGNVTVRKALSNSLNVPSVEIMSKVGVIPAIEMAKRLGITTLKNPSDYGLSLVLGAGGIPLLEMTSVYSVFANRGEKNPPVSILGIKDKEGNLIYKFSPSPESVLSPEVTFLISSILSDNNARQEEFGNALTINRPAAVKTGTSEDFRDALTLGYTPSLAIGVWVGNNDNRPMDNIAGSLGAAPIWKNLMESFLMGAPIENFTPPANIVFISCQMQTRTATTSGALGEYFIRGTEPSTCNLPTSSPTPFISVFPPPTFSSPTISSIPTSSITPSQTPVPTSTPTPSPSPIPSPTPSFSPTSSH